MGVDFSGNAAAVAELPAGLDNIHTFSVLGLAFLPSSATTGRQIWGKGGFVKYCEVPSDFSFLFRVNRGTQASHRALARTNVSTVPLDAPFLAMFTFDTTDGPRIFTRSLTGQFAEQSYATRTIGSGSANDDSGDVWRFGNAPSLNFSWQGHLYAMQHFSRRISDLTEMDLLGMQMLAEASTNYCILFGLGAANAVDFSAGARAVTVANAAVVENPALPYLGIVGGRAVNVAAAGGGTTPVEASLVCGWESLGAVEQSAAPSWEAVAAIERAAASAYESLGGVDVSQGESWEALGAIEQLASPSWESLQLLEALRSSDWESLAAVDLSQMSEHEAVGYVEQILVAAWEAEGTAIVIAPRAVRAALTQLIPKIRGAAELTPLVRGRTELTPKIRGKTELPPA